MKPGDAEFDIFLRKVCTDALKSIHSDHLVAIEEMREKLKEFCAHVAGSGYLGFEDDHIPAVITILREVMNSYLDEMPKQGAEFIENMTADLQWMGWYDWQEAAANGFYREPGACDVLMDEYMHRISCQVKDMLDGTMAPDEEAHAARVAMRNQIMREEMGER